MLSASVTTTPRPRPPGRTRRISTHVKSSPPPPYAVTSLLNDPLDNSSDLKRESFNDPSVITPWDDIPNHPQVWNGRSHEELSELLLKADEIIKDRENELSVTTAVCKSLYENNLELQNKHKALLARLPTSPASVSPSGSSASSPTTPGTPLPHSPHCYTNISSSHASTSASRSCRSQRRISVSPADLALLSDQNAELLAKLEKLESESAQTDQAGRRKLRGLEKEIQELREELDKTRARSDELEQKAKIVSLGLESEEATKRRHEREERVRAMRGRSEGNTSDGEVRDFAPGGALASQGFSKRSTGLGRSEKRKFPSQGLRRHTSEIVFRSSPTDSKLSELSRKMSLRHGLSRSSSQSQFPPTQTPVPATPEYALVSQLLQKIRELEQINSQITLQQAKTTASLQSVQRDAASIQLLYESLSDVDAIAWLAEDDNIENSDVHEGDEHVEEDETIRFASLRQSMLVDPSVEFDSGIEPDRQSSVRHAILPELFPPPAHHRTRRSVVGLFDPPTVPDVSNSPSVQSPIIPDLPTFPFVPQPTGSTDFVTSEELDVSSSRAAALPTTEFSGRQTLDNELGLAWDNCHRNDHFRTPSLIDLTLLSPSLSTDNAGGVPDSSTHSTQDLLSFPPSSSYISAPASSTSFAEQVSLQTGTWQGVHDSESVAYSPPNGHVETLADKKRRKSHTIRMRTNHWTEGRFEATLLSAPRRESSVDLVRPSTPVPQRLVNEFVDSISRHRTHPLSGSLTDDELRTASASPVSPRQGKRPRQQRFKSFVLELWLWLQFAIVVVVFLWAMAKRGPKSVLEEAQKRKIQ